MTLPTRTQRPARPCRGPAAFHDDPLAPPIVSTPLCDLCTRRVRSALLDMPQLYVDLWQALTPGTRGGGPRVSGGDIEAPLPLDIATQQLMDQAVDLVATWVEIVADVRRILTAREALASGRPAPNWRSPALTSRGATVATGSAYLQKHLAVLLQLGEQTITTRVTTREVEEDGARQIVLESPIADHNRLLDAMIIWDTDGGRTSLQITGVDAALLFLAWRRDVRRHLGATRGKDRLRDECPNDGCGARALVRWHGDNKVQCEICGREWFEGDYQRLVRNLARRERRNET